MTTQHRTPRTPTRTELVRRACAHRGVQIVELAGGTFRLLAPGVDIWVTDLRYVETRDLRPLATVWNGAAA